MEPTPAAASALEPHIFALADGREPESHKLRYAQYRVIRRNGAVVPFEPTKILVAVSKAFLAVHGGAAAASSAAREKITGITDATVERLMRRQPNGGSFHIEDIQDQVELSLMRAEEHEVARSYILYREGRQEERKQRHEEEDSVRRQVKVHAADGSQTDLDFRVIEQAVAAATEGLEDVSASTVAANAERELFDGVSMGQVHQALILAARSLIEEEPNYSFVAARLLLNQIAAEVSSQELSREELALSYGHLFKTNLAVGVEHGLLNPALLAFDLDRLADAIEPKRDLALNYLGLQTLYDRYFLHVNHRRIELPQSFFMRVAMGLALDESDKEHWAIQFYHVLSNFDFMSSTPTLFNAGTVHSQLSSCYLSTISDDLDGIYEGIKENALLSKFAGGLGNDWSRVRSLGAHIKGTNGKSQGVIPFLKVVNDTAVAVNQGGKREGAVCAFLETWHLDIEDFLELRKNTGDDRRRTHDMNTANWIPDLFMKRVQMDGEWTLFSPSDVPDLHDLWGQAFEQAYQAYEKKTHSGEISLFKRVSAVGLWRKMLSMLFETGHPWITFKDAANARSPQQHRGVVHSSNLCTEITLNTSDTETAVCNLGSVNLVNHIEGGLINDEKLQATIRIAMRMLDNVIDLNFYPVKKARQSNLKHRPVGMGIMGFQDCLYELGLPYASPEAVHFADHSMERVAYYAYLASTELAEERGVYPSYKGSLWDQGILPQDTLALLRQQRGGQVEVDERSSLDWTEVRRRIQQYGMRNSNCLAIAPTATIANIVGVSASIEPTFSNVYVKSNLSGEFTVLNRYLVRELKAQGLWDKMMVMDLKYFEGSLGRIDRVPEAIKHLYASAFEMDPAWLVEAAARRQKWIDQAQSLNIYLAEPSGKKLEETYFLAWVRGLKTTYYLRTRGASMAEKSTVESNALKGVMAQPAFCSMEEGCESCQ